MGTDLMVVDIGIGFCWMMRFAPALTLRMKRRIAPLEIASSPN
ncbi:hypothetical protein [Ensifer adhaerens]|nr:hypothetical protein [Ensifer adhaerens]